ncbi:hypothetical protein [Maribacter sp. 2-571]|uniref:hypothetical protein n=1 Tax=Maribacter sp. 2-571 TaxID=3417569 RepID=UPI003D3432C7
MRTLRMFILLGFLGSSSLQGQVKIGDNPQTIDPSAVLELESSTGALIITRITTDEMEAIVPDRGAVVYNTDAQCVFYYNGTQWISLCDSTLELTAEASDGGEPTILLTPTAEGTNIEIAPGSITGAEIGQGVIFGDNINAGSIQTEQLADNSVGLAQLRENSVGPFALDQQALPLSTFVNDVPFLTAPDLPSPVSTDPGNVLSLGGDDAAFYNDQALVDAIALNTTAIANDTDGNPLNELQILSITGNTLRLSRPDGSINEVPLEDVLSGNQSVEEVDGITLSGVGTNLDPFTITPSATANQVLTTNAALEVVWNNLPTGGGGSVNTDGTTISGNGDDNPLTITPSATANQFLTTNAGGEVEWVTVTPGGGTTELADQVTIVGNGQTGSEFQVADGAVTTLKIVDDNVTPDKIAGGTEGQVLTTDAAGDVLWNDPQVVAVNTTAAIDGDGTLGNELDIADGAVTTLKILDNNVTPDKIAEGTEGQVLTTDTAGDVLWNDPQVVAVNTTAAIDGDGTLGNELDIADGAVTTLKILDNNVTPDKIVEGTDGQVLTTDAAGDVLWNDPQVVAVNTTAAIDGDGTLGNELDIADGAVTTLKIVDDNVTPDKIAEGTDGQVLTTDAAGDVLWNDPQVVAVNTTAAIDGDGTTTNPLNLAANSVGTDELVDDSITPNKLATTGIPDGYILIMDSGAPIWRQPNSGAPLKTSTSGAKKTSIRRVSDLKVAVGENDHTLILEETVAQLILPSAQTNLGTILVIKDLGGVSTRLNIPYRDFGNSTVNTIDGAAVLWLQSDGTEWQLIK